MYRTCTSSLYASTYGQLTKEFGCSQEVAILGLSLFVIGLAIGPMVVSPLSEVRLEICYPRRLLIPFQVLWSPANIRPFHDIFSDLVDSLRGCTEYTDDASRAVLQRLIWKCISQCCCRDCSRFVYTEPDSSSHDVVHNRSFSRTRSWAFTWWFHQSIYILVRYTRHSPSHILTPP
jgi:hypothetical protein